MKKISLSILLLASGYSFAMELAVHKASQQVEAWKDLDWKIKSPALEENFESWKGTNYPKLSRKEKMPLEFLAHHAIMAVIMNFRVPTDRKANLTSLSELLLALPNTSLAQGKMVQIITSPMREQNYSETIAVLMLFNKLLD